MTKKTSYSFIVALAVISALFFAPKGVFAKDYVLYNVPYTGNSGGSWWNDTLFTPTENSVASNFSFYIHGTWTATDVYVALSKVTGNDNAHTCIFTSDPAGHAFPFISATTTYSGTPGAYPTPYGCQLESGAQYKISWVLNGGGGSPFPIDVSFGTTPNLGFPPQYTVTDIVGLTPQITDPFTQTATTTVTYYITPADLAAGTTTLSYVITTQDSIGYNPAQIGTIIATSSGLHTDTFYMGTGQAAWSAFYTLAGVAGEDPNIGAFYSVATSTFWVNGTSTLLNITTSTSTGTTTNGSSLAQCKSSGGLIDFDYYSCLIGNRFSDVFQWLFIPKAGSLDQYQAMKTTLETKVPFGYFFLIKNAISGVNASSTSAFTLTLDQGVLAGIITPIRTALAWILFMGFGFWFYMRMKHLDIW